jgi:hypothetical protein
MVQQLTQMKRRAGMWRWESGSVQRQWTRGMSTTILPETVVANLRSCTTTTHTVSFLIPFPHSRSRHQLHKIRHTCAVETTNHHRLQNLNYKTDLSTILELMSDQLQCFWIILETQAVLGDAHPVSASRLNLHSNENVSWGLFPLQQKYTKSQVWSVGKAVSDFVNIY